MVGKDSSPKVLINDRCLVAGRTGISVYLRNLLDHWPGETALEPVCYCRDRHDRLCRLVQRARPIARPPVLRTLKDMLSRRRRMQGVSRRFNSSVLKIYSAALASCFNRGDFNCYFEPDNLAADCDGPTVTTVFDLSVFEHPQWHPPDRVARWRADWQRSSGATDHWIVACEFTRGRMTDLLSIAPEDITVIPLAGRPLRYPLGEDLQRMAKLLGLPDKYFLCLGALQPRKNITVLLDAYQALPPKIRDACKLILAGPAAWGSRSFWRSLSEHPAAEHVLAGGFVSDDIAALLLSGATALLAPSRYEGFGLPLVEAMACGTPVICSAIAPFKEVAGSAAEFVAPDDVGGWSQAMRKAIEEPLWRDAMAADSLERSKAFSWAACARAHLAVMERTAGMSAT